MMPTKVEISHRTIIFAVLFLFFLWFLFQIRQIILFLFISLILMSALNPLVIRLEKRKIPRALSILLIYFLIIGFLGLILGSLVSPLVEQTTRFLEHLPALLQQFSFIQIDQPVIANQLNSVPGKLLKFIISIFSNFIGLFVLMVITFYLLMERKKLGRYLLILFGKENDKQVEGLIDKIESQLGSWVRGQIILCIIVGVMVYIGLRFLGIDFALPLALLAGILEVVPNIGPVLSAFPAVLLSLAVSPVSTLAVIALYFLVQQIENYLIVPSVMRRAVSLSPLIVILSLMVGFKIGGISGAVLALPVVLVIRVFSSEILSSKKFQEI